MAVKTRFEVISKEDYERIHEASLKILRETGVVFHHESARELLKKQGAVVQNKTVFFKRQLIEEALRTCPSTFLWRGRNESRSVIVGKDFLVQPNVGPVYIQDLDKGRREATLKDFVNIQKLCQASDVVDLVGSIPVEASDVAKDEKHLQIMYEIIKNTDKPLNGYCGNAKQVMEQLDMVELAVGGREIMEKGHYAGVLVNPQSPLGFAPDTLETMMEYSKRNQPILLAPCIMAGATGPVSLLGTAVLQNTEILAGLVLTQLIRPGTPVVYSTASTTANMRNASYGAGTPEAMLINTASLQMGLEYYHLPTRTMCGITYSKAVDCQAGYETMQSLLMGSLSGAHIGVQCLGVLDAIMTTSYEKFIIDEELVSRVKRILKGIDTSHEALAVEVIQEVGPDETYLKHKSTLKEFRSFWQPNVSNWEHHDEWKKKGAEGVEMEANRRFKKILGEAPETFIDATLDKELKAYMAKAVGNM